MREAQWGVDFYDKDNKIHHHNYPQPSSPTRAHNGSAQRSYSSIFKLPHSLCSDKTSFWASNPRQQPSNSALTHSPRGGVRGRLAIELLVLGVAVFSNRVASTRGGWFFSDKVYHFFLGVPLIFGTVFKIITANSSLGENRGCRPAAVFPGQSWDAAQFGGLPHLALLSTKCCHLHTVLPKRKCN